MMTKTERDLNRAAGQYFAAGLLLLIFLSLGVVALLGAQ